jgi:hypothetical protein
MEAGAPLSPGGASADSLEFASSPHSQNDDHVLQQKKPSPDGANEGNRGFAKRGCSRSLNGFSKSTMANTHTWIEPNFVSKNAALRVLCRYIEMLSSGRKRAS